MSRRSEWILVAGLILLTVISVILLRPDVRRDDSDWRTSSFRATPGGVLALYLFIEELGIPVERRMTPLVQGERLPHSLALLAPTERLSPTEVDSLLAWIESGGALFYAAIPGDTVLAALGLVIEPAVPDSVETKTWELAATPATSHPLTADVDSVRAIGYVFADSSASLVTGGTALLRVADGRAALVLLQRGQGRVFAWSDPAPLANDGLMASGAALIAARIATDLVTGGASLHFDEYHHGFRGGGSPAQVLLGFLRDTGTGRTIVQLVLAGLGLLVLLGRRFGAPHPASAARRRSPLEHLHALAGAYEAGGARDRSRHLLLSGVARRLGHPPPAPGEESAYIAGLATGGYDSEAVEEFRDAWSRSGEGDLIGLAASADRLVAGATERRKQPSERVTILIPN